MESHGHHYTPDLLWTPKSPHWSYKGSVNTSVSTGHHPHEDVRVNGSHAVCSSVYESPASALSGYGYGLSADWQAQVQACHSSLVLRPFTHHFEQNVALPAKCNGR
jgi:hypothetical protein